MLNDRDKTYLFLCGLHRSGTSLLFQLLRDHPEISGFQNTGVPEDEGQHLQSVFPVAKSFGGPGIFGFSSDAYLDNQSKLISPENKSRLLSEWGRYWDMEKKYLLEKSPPNLIRTLFFQEMFENTIFIAIIRHPLATSYATQKWSKTSIEDLIRHWLLCHDRFMEDAKKLKKVMVIRYEKFVDNPTEVMSKMYRLVGIEPSPITKEVKSNINEKYFSNWFKYERNIFTRWKANKIYAAYERRVENYGYSLRNVEKVEDIHSSAWGTDYNLI